MSELHDARVLVLEDELLLAMAYERLLYDEGCGQVLLTTRVDQALKVIQQTLLTVALLDVSLRGSDLSFPVADALADAGIPFVFLTAYRPEHIPERHRTRPLIEKPTSEKAIVQALGAAIAQRV
ncbi:response regulator [Reyranella sp. CPCC 100927]|uniref:response regulator n=1 Tax=Reyranella sp. CPCC 100927 TaxID=2599616 RepID=UPI0011B552F5|nr:response regulator [Reyranella sp. CPCC 100927]TWT15725.1 response regulator [Reyranella sp. CPCC 100927]